MLTQSTPYPWPSPPTYIEAGGNTTTINWIDVPLGISIHLWSFTPLPGGESTVVTTAPTAIFQCGGQRPCLHLSALGDHHVVGTSKPAYLFVVVFFSSQSRREIFA